MRLATIAVAGLAAVFAGAACGGGSGGGPSGPSATLTGSVRGVVRDDGGAAVSGATVQLSATGKAARTTTSGTDGGYAFTNVDAGIWQVFVVPPAGYSGGSTPTVTVSGNQEATVGAIVLTKLSAGAAPTSADVLIYQSAFVPANVTIKAGGSVTWRNSDPVAHTATGSAFDTGNLGLNATSTKIFATAGTYNYICSIHPGMTGRVTVVQ